MTSALDRLLVAARNALVRLDREDAAKRAAGAPAPHDGVAGSVNQQLRLAIADAEEEQRRTVHVSFVSDEVCVSFGTEDPSR